MMRSRSVQIAGRLSYREAIERHYAAHPDATLDETTRATGAPKATVRCVRLRLIASGRLSAKVVDWLAMAC